MAYTTRPSLLARLAEGDDAAWFEFNHRYGELIRSVARQQGMQLADIDDVVQEVLAALTGVMPGFTYDPTKGKFRGYLKTIVRHAVINRFRQIRRTPTVPLYESTASDASGSNEFDQVWEDQWRAHHVARAMRRLESEFGEKDRLAFSQHAHQQRSAAESAEALGMSVDQVYQARSRIMRRLRALIAEQVEEDG